MTDNELYRCIFYHSRSCPLREQMDWTDEKIRDEINAISYTLEKRVKVNGVEYLYKFCNQCPHIRQNPKLEHIIAILNVANPVSIEMKNKLEEEIKKLLL